jgi:hypothetical protein
MAHILALAMTFLSVVPLTAGVAQTFDDELSELVLEVNLEPSGQPEFIPVTQGQDIKRTVGLSSRYTASALLAIELVWATNDRVVLHVREYGILPLGVNLTSELLEQLKTSEIGSYPLELDHPVLVEGLRCGLTAKFVLRPNAPDEPANLRIEDYGVKSIEVGKVTETRGFFLIEIVNASTKAVRSLAFGTQSGIV